MDSGKNPLDVIASSISPVASEVLSAAAAGTAPGIKDTSADIWGALVGDRVKLWRLRNWASGLEKTAHHINNMGVDLANAHSLPYGEMLTLFDGISKEDDVDLSDMWARLIAKAMTEDKPPSISSRAVAAVLEQLSPDSARAFSLLAKIRRFEFIVWKLSRFQSQEFFPLTPEEKLLDEEGMKAEKIQLEQEIEAERSRSVISGASLEANLEVSKAELLRLNLIDPKRVAVPYDDSPFRSGMQVNAAGLDAVVSDLFQKTRELVDSRTLPAALPFWRSEHSKESNFELTLAGIEIAKKLSFIGS